MIFYILAFLVSIFILTWLSSHLIETLVKLAKYLSLREFIIAFFIMALAGSLPNLFVGIGSVLRGFPELAFGDILDGKLGRIDGIMLILAFFIYSFWLFSRGDRFKKIYAGKRQQPIEGFSNFFKNLIKIIVILIVILVASQIIINSAQYFSNKLGLSISLVGLLIIGLGNCFPEAYFSIVSARRGESSMILGDLMGSVISCATLVLGIIAVVLPFQINDFSPFLIARIFFIIALAVFLIAIRTDRKITKKEAIVLLFVYIAFLLVEVFKPVIF